MKRRVGCLFIALPLIGLAIDYALSPRVFESTAPAKLSVVSLLEHDRVRIGTFHAHAIDVGLDRVDQPDYLGFLATGGPNAIVLPSFLRDDQPRFATFGDAVEKKLESLSPIEARKLGELLADQRGFNAGDVRDVELKLPAEERKAFPIDRIFVVVLDHSSGMLNQDNGYYASAFTKLMARASSLRIDTLVLPPIGYNWYDNSSVKLSSIFRGALAALPESAKPARVYFDLYEEEPTSVLEDAVASLNAAAEQFEQTPEGLQRLHRRDVRLLLLFLSVCLAASSFFAPLDFKAFLLICGGYIGLYGGATLALGRFGSAMALATRDWLQLIISLILAVTFPITVHWKLADIFAPKEGKA
ncbi:MAG TPA: hypothetical protein VLC46_10570 [Thermoanaerobaculia bacterium]|nr:hypothetical protein [Thermoanaerobaculia bacterium]